MKPLLQLHQLATPKRAGEIARLVDGLHRDRRQVVIWVADDGLRQILDDFLWSFNKLAFVPHLLWSPEMGEVDDPVVLVGEPSNPNRAEVMVVGDTLPPEDWAATFAAVHDLIPPGEVGEERTTWWERWSESLSEEENPNESSG